MMIIDQFIQFSTNTHTPHFTLASHSTLTSVAGMKLSSFHLSVHVHASTPASATIALWRKRLVGKNLCWG